MLIVTESRHYSVYMSFVLWQCSTQNMSIYCLNPQISRSGSGEYCTQHTTRRTVTVSFGWKLTIWLFCRCLGDNGKTCGV